MNDEPFRFIYINTIREKDEAEKWMNEKAITDENIYIHPEA